MLWLLKKTMSLLLREFICHMDLWVVLWMKCIEGFLDLRKVACLHFNKTTAGQLTRKINCKMDKSWGPKYGNVIFFYKTRQCPNWNFEPIRRIVRDLLQFILCGPRMSNFTEFHGNSCSSCHTLDPRRYREFKMYVNAHTYIHKLSKEGKK